MKIGFLYLNVSNLGDTVIYNTARYITEDILRRNHLDNWELVPVDIGSFQVKQVAGQTVEAPPSKRGKLMRLLRKAMNVVGPNPLSYWFLRKMWHQTNTYKHFAAHEQEKLKDVDMIIFCGGGMIKYHQQNFHYFIDEIVRMAEKRNIPVLMNSVGIEGYEEKNIECRFLKHALNQDCMKFISTRDDFNTLVNQYITNPKIKTVQVCDPAFWTMETFGVTERKTEPGKIGLNVIRTKIFKQYMYSVSERSLVELYYELICKLLANGNTVELFSNGVEADGKFINALFETYPELRENPAVTVAYPKTAAELVDIISHYERFMAVRLHASIIGTVMGIPNVSLVWNRKQPLFGEQVGMPENYLVKEEFQADTIFSRLMAAEGYVMNEAYKHSVYDALEEQILKYVG